MSLSVPLSGQIPSRQIHLDFHNSPAIDDLGREFNAGDFAAAMEASGAQSVTIFAKCHHGMCYYPTRCGNQHPALKGRDLLGEQIEALHGRGIRCPLYLTVGLEEDAAHRHLDWRQLTREGHSIRAKPMMAGQLLPGGWYFMNWLHPEYQGLIEAHLEELFRGYEVDGIFFDILVFDPSGGWSEEAVKFRRQWGLEQDDPATFDRFLGAAQDRFSRRFSSFIRERNREAGIFYNAAAVLTTDHRKGIRIRAEQQSHYEIESLPTGHWGYHHFPRIARFVSGLGKPWIGQTGRFQKSWGDFGGIKPVPALEYECFRSQALGGAVGIGDQLHPEGKLDADALSLIGSVFARVREAEAFYEGAEPLFDIGILAAGAPGCDWPQVQQGESGAVMLCQRARRNPVLLDDAASFESLPAVILPDTVLVSDALADRLRSYHEKGGRLILSGRSGFDGDGNWRLDFLPFRPTGANTFHPTYWRTPAELCPKWSGADHVIYAKGMLTELREGASGLVQRVHPRFQRTDARFSSHFQAPPNREPADSPAVVAGDRFVYFADPVFREFRQSGQIYLADIWCACLERLLGRPLLDTALPPSIEVIAARRGEDLLLTLLRYLPVRKALEIDIIDERLPFDGEQLAFSKTPRELVRYPDGRPLEKSNDGSFRLTGRGRLLLTCPGYFKAGR